MLRSKIQIIEKRSFDGCCEAKYRLLKSGALMDVANQNPDYYQNGALMDVAKQNPIKPTYNLLM